jgi:hypothetical protein
MPYTQYATHFRPTAVCGSCGGRVRLRRYRTIVAVTFLCVAVLAVIVVLTRSVAVAVTGMALGTLLGLLADFWTFRNLSWDPIDGTSPSEGTSA